VPRDISRRDQMQASYEQSIYSNKFGKRGCQTRKRRGYILPGKIATKGILLTLWDWGEDLRLIEDLRKIKESSERG
jgi:RES domain-containing protein